MTPPDVFTCWLETPAFCNEVLGLFAERMADLTCLIDAVALHKLDRILRIVAGLVLLGLMATGSIGVWGWLGLVPLATGLIGWCPAYTLLGLNSCPMKNRG